MATPKTPHSLHTFIIHSTPHFIIVKLTIDNNLLWKAQIIPLLKGHQLLGYVNGSLPLPPPSLDDKPNPAHSQWLEYDQLIVATLNSSFSESVLV